VDGDRAELWLVADGRATRRTVTLGLRGLAMTEVTDGLADGDTVLADAAAAVAEGDRVRVREAALPAAGADPATRKELPAKFD
jgi:HlyD family secretion protein